MTFLHNNLKKVVNTVLGECSPFLCPIFCFLPAPLVFSQKPSRVSVLWKNWVWRAAKTYVHVQTHYVSKLFFIQRMCYFGWGFGAAQVGIQRRSQGGLFQGLVANDALNFFSSFLFACRLKLEKQKSLVFRKKYSLSNESFKKKYTFCFVHSIFFYILLIIQQFSIQIKVFEYS